MASEAARNASACSVARPLGVEDLLHDRVVSREARVRRDVRGDPGVQTEHRPEPTINDGRVALDVPVGNVDDVDRLRLADPHQLVENRCAAVPQPRRHDDAGGKRMIRRWEAVDPDPILQRDGVPALCHRQHADHVAARRQPGRAGVDQAGDAVVRGEPLLGDVAHVEPWARRPKQFERQERSRCVLQQRFTPRPRRRLSPLLETLVALVRRVAGRVLVDGEGGDDPSHIGKRVPRQAVGHREQDCVLHGGWTIGERGGLPR